MEQFFEIELLHVKDFDGLSKTKISNISVPSRRAHITEDKTDT